MWNPGSTTALHALTLALLPSAILGIPIPFPSAHPTQCSSSQCLLPSQAPSAQSSSSSPSTSSEVPLSHLMQQQTLTTPSTATQYHRLSKRSALPRGRAPKSAPKPAPAPSRGKSSAPSRGRSAPPSPKSSPRAPEKPKEHKRSWQQKIRDSFHNAGKKIKSGFQNAGKKMKEGFQNAGKKIKSGFQNAGKKIKQGFQNAGKGIKKVWNKVEGGLRKAGGWITKVWAKGQEVLAPIVGKIPGIGKILQPAMKAESMVTKNISKGLFGSNGNGTGSFKKPFVDGMAELGAKKDKNGKYKPDGKAIASTIGGLVG